MAALCEVELFEYAVERGAEVYITAGNAGPVAKIVWPGGRLEVCPVVLSPDDGQLYLLCAARAPQG